MTFTNKNLKVVVGFSKKSSGTITCSEENTLLSLLEKQISFFRWPSSKNQRKIISKLL